MTLSKEARAVAEIVVLHRGLYSISAASRILDMPASTLARWLLGQDGRPPVLRPEPTGARNVTWGEFVEAGLLRQVSCTGVSLQRIRVR